MARPEKRGISYFNIDCDQEDKLEYILAKHKVEGYGIVVQLWRKIYSIEGYFCPWSEKNIYLFAKDNGVDVDTLNAVVETCFEEDIFSRKMYQNHGVLTSSGVQKRWLRIVKEAKRKDQQIEAKLSLLQFLPEKVEFTPEETPKIHVESTQTKVKESKVKESKGSNTRESENEPPALVIEILAYFGFTWWVNSDKLRTVGAFIKKIEESDQLTYFEKQFENYQLYKKTANELKHNFTSFLGRPETRFEGGKWDEANWEQKILEFNNKANGKVNQRGTSTVRHTATPGKTFGSL